MTTSTTSLPTVPDPPATGPAKPKPQRRYQAIQSAAVASMVLGLLSALSGFHPFFWLIPAGGVALAQVARRAIRRAPEEITGAVFAQVGLYLSLSLFALGSSWWLYCYFSSVPPGYTKIAFAELQPDPKKPSEPPPAVAEFEKEGVRVFLQGYMAPGKRPSGI